MLNSADKRKFLRDVEIIDDDLLEKVVEWVGHYLSPEDVFDIEELMYWAEKNYEENK